MRRFIDRLDATLSALLFDVEGVSEVLSDVFRGGEVPFFRGGHDGSFELFAHPQNDDGVLLSHVTRYIPSIETYHTLSLAGNTAALAVPEKEPTMSEGRRIADLGVRDGCWSRATADKIIAPVFDALEAEKQKTARLERERNGFWNQRDAALDKVQQLEEQVETLRALVKDWYEQAVVYGRDGEEDREATDALDARSEAALSD